MAEEVALHVGGERFAGFESITVTQAFAASLVPTSFSVSYAPRVAERLAPVRIEAGDEVTIRVGEEDLVHGYVDDDDLGYDAKATSFAAVGRSVLGDLVDCSAQHPSRRFRDQTLFAIAGALLSDYPVGLIDLARELEPIERFAIQDGETIADCILRAARLRGVVLQDVGGDLVITRTGTERTQTVIERGRNVLSGQRRRSWRERFSHYDFRGQTRATDEVNGLDAAQIGHTVEDREVTRPRRLAVTAHAGRREDLGRRAVLERNTRAGRSERLSYEVSGWTTDEGALWRPNVRVRVLDDWFDVDAELLVERVIFSHAAQPARYRTRLELVRPETFSELDFPVRGRGRGWR